jgi:hypothetical protein
LAEGNYEIRIDGEAAAKATAAELAAGINLSGAEGPVTKQTREILSLVFHKNDLFFDRWRNVQLYSFPGWAKGPAVEEQRQAEIRRIDAVIAAEEAKIDAARQPRKHRFVVKRAGQ